MPTVSCQMVVAGDVEKVFDFISDYRNIARLQPHFSDVKLVSEAERGLGATIEMRGSFRGLPMRVRDRIITFTPPRRLVSISEGTVTSRNTWEFALVDADPPKTRVTFRVDYKMGGGLLGGLITGMAAPLLSREIQGMTEESLRRLESIFSLRAIANVADFERIYNSTLERVGRFQAPSPELEVLMRQLYGELIRWPVNLRELRQALVALLTFLTTPEGKTNANLYVVDLFICLGDWSPPEWHGIDDPLPDDYMSIICDMGGALHDTLGAPEIAANFDSTPEQLLERAMRLNA